MTKLLLDFDLLSFLGDLSLGGKGTMKVSSDLNRLGLSGDTRLDGALRLRLLWILLIFVSSVTE